MRNLFASIELGFASNPLTSEEEATAQAAYDDEDYKTALPLLRRGAKEGDPDALHRLGVMLSWARSAHMNFMRRLANKTILQFCSVLDITTGKVRALRKTYSKRGASMSGRSKLVVRSHSSTSAGCMRTVLVAIAIFKRQLTCISVLQTRAGPTATFVMRVAFWQGICPALIVL